MSKRKFPLQTLSERKVKKKFDNTLRTITPQIIQVTKKQNVYVSQEITPLRKECHDLLDFALSKNPNNLFFQKLKSMININGDKEHVFMTLLDIRNRTRSSLGKKTLRHFEQWKVNKEKESK